MIPISDENPTLRTPVVTYAIIIALGAVWLLVQGAGTPQLLMQSVCNLGLIPGELTGMAQVGDRIQVAQNAWCAVDDDPINIYTPLTSMFLHGGWMHLIGNAWFLWIFGNNVEDSMGRGRFVIFYVLCGLLAAGAQVMMDVDGKVPMVGASGAISGVMGAYLVLYPRVRVRMFFFYMVWTMPAYLVLLWWIGLQVINSMLQAGIDRGGVAYAAHIGGFIAGIALVKLFENRQLTAERNRLRHRFHPMHP